MARRMIFIEVEAGPKRTVEIADAIGSLDIPDVTDIVVGITDKEGKRHAPHMRLIHSDEAAMLSEQYEGAVKTGKAAR